MLPRSKFILRRPDEKNSLARLRKQTRWAAGVASGPPACPSLTKTTRPGLARSPIQQILDVSHEALFSDTCLDSRLSFQKRTAVIYHRTILGREAVYSENSGF